MSTTKELEQLVDELESAVYDTLLCYQNAYELHDEAWDVFGAVLDHYGLSYFCPGEPEAENEDRSVVIPLTSIDAGNNGGMMTDEEEEKVRQPGGYGLPGDLYWARLRVRQARDILEDGWQFGLEEPEESE